MTDEQESIVKAKTKPADIQERNKRYVQIDAIGVGTASAAAPFLPVFLTRLGASPVQVGLLTSMPGFTGFILALWVGRFLQRQRNVVPWFSVSRLLVISAYALTGLIPFFVPDNILILVVLLIWALATLPQTMVAVGFSVVMNAVSGPEGRYELTSRRWSTWYHHSHHGSDAGQVLINRLPPHYQLVCRLSLAPDQPLLQPHPDPGCRTGGTSRKAQNELARVLPAAQTGTSLCLLHPQAICIFFWLHVRYTPIPAILCAPIGCFRCLDWVVVYRSNGSAGGGLFLVVTPIA
jgi:hypothetical protein